MKIIHLMLVTVICLSSVYGLEEQGLTTTIVTLDKLSSTQKIYPGWNLVPLSNPFIRTPELTANKAFDGFATPMGCGSTEGDESGSFITTALVYLPNHGFFGGSIEDKSRFKFSSDDEEKIKHAKSKYYQEIQSQSTALSTYSHAQWVYSTLPCEYPIALVDQQVITLLRDSAISKTSLTKGWNLIHNQLGLFGGSMSNYIGDCTIQKVNQWNPITQKWIYKSVQSEDQATNFATMPITAINLFSTYAIKVTETCTFGTPFLTNRPPPMPD